jgi:hypothetical protein
MAVASQTTTIGELSLLESFDLQPTIHVPRSNKRRRLLNTYGTKLFGDFAVAPTYYVAKGYELTSGAEYVLRFERAMGTGAK